MKGGKSLCRRARQRWPIFVRSQTFAIVVAPSLLAFFGIVLGDWLGEPGWAAIFTLLLAMVLILGFLVWEPGGWRVSDGLAADERPVRAEALVIGGSHTSGATQSEWEKSAGQAVTIGRVEPIAIIGVETVGAEQAMEFMKVFAGSRWVDNSSIGKGEASNPAEMCELFTRAIRLLRTKGHTDIAVDITAGTKPMSIAAYQAAINEGVKAIYLEQVPRNERGRSLLLWDPEEASLSEMETNR